MGKLYKYQPTLGMSKEDRTEANYITKILGWLHSVEDLLTTVTSISYTEKGCTLTPLAENINGKPIAIEVSDSNILYSTKTGNQSPAWSTNSISLTNDPFLYIASDTDGVSIGGGTTPWMMGIYTGHLFDGTELGIEVDTSGLDLIWFTGNGVRNGNSQYYGKEAVGNFASYCVKPFTFAASGVITNHIMSLDGGIQSPSRGSIFTINDETYIGIIGNYALKV